MIEVDGEDVVRGVDGVNTVGDADPLEGDAGPGELGNECHAGDMDDGGLPGGDDPGVGPGDVGDGEAARWARVSRGTSGCWTRVLARGAEAEDSGGHVAWDMQGACRST